MILTKSSAARWILPDEGFFPMKWGKTVGFGGRERPPFMTIDSRKKNFSVTGWRKVRVQQTFLTA